MPDQLPMIDLLSLLQCFLLRIHQGRRLTLDECPLSHQGGMGHPDEHILIARKRLSFEHAGHEARSICNFLGKRRQCVCVLGGWNLSLMSPVFPWGSGLLGLFLLVLCSSTDAGKAVILNASSLTSSCTREQTMFLVMVFIFFFSPLENF